MADYSWIMQATEVRVDGEPAVVLGWISPEVFQVRKTSTGRSKMIHGSFIGRAHQSSTHPVYMGDGYWVTSQHCEMPGCDDYLGINYPSSFCDFHLPKPLTD